MNYSFSKRAKIVLSKSIKFFEKYVYLNISIKETIFQSYFLVKSFFINSIFEPLYFLKLRRIFDELTFLLGFFWIFPWWYVDSCPKMLIFKGQLISKWFFDFTTTYDTSGRLVFVYLEEIDEPKKPFRNQLTFKYFLR